MKRPKAMKRGDAGFTLLEVLIAAAIMGIAVAGVLSAIAASTRNAARLTAYDRASLLAKSKMDELLVNQKLQRKVPVEGTFDPAQTGGTPVGWRATVTPFEWVPGASAGMWVMDRVQLEIWWMDGSTRHAFTLEGFRRGVLNPGDI